MAKETTTAKPKKEKKRRGRFFKETFSELKKVTWPSFSSVVKQTGIVLGVVLVFLVVLMGFDMLLQWLYDVIVQEVNAGTGETLSSAMSTFTGLLTKSGVPIWA